MNKDINNLKIKNYQIHYPPLAEGAYGKVFRATYRGISDRALKVFQPNAIDLSIMARELEKLSEVREHANIVTLHDFDLLNYPPYYAMSLHANQNSDGTWRTRTLDDICGKLDYKESWRIISQIADSIAYLHKHQIIHCDVKPSNILLTDEDPIQVKICDFGQSREFTTKNTTPAGTPLYASPEQLKNPKDSTKGLGFKWDVYSFGIVAFKLLTGKIPRIQNLSDAAKNSIDLESTISELSLESTIFEENQTLSPKQIAILIEAEETIQWPQNHYIPSSYKEIIEKCIKINPSDRPDDMMDVYGQIEKLKQQNIVNKSRRLTLIFALLSTFTIISSIFAIFQSYKSKESEKKVQASLLKEKQSNEVSRELLKPIINIITNTSKDDLNKYPVKQMSKEIYKIIAKNKDSFLKILLDSGKSINEAEVDFLKLNAQNSFYIAKAARKKNDFGTALESYYNSYQINYTLYEKIKEEETFVHFLVRDLLHMGEIEEINNNFEKAINYYKEANEKLIEILKGNLSKYSKEPFKRIINIYKQSNDFKSALVFINEYLNKINATNIEGKFYPKGNDFILKIIPILKDKIYFLTLSGNSKNTINSIIESHKQIINLVDLKSATSSNKIKLNLYENKILSINELANFLMKIESYKEASDFYLMEYNIINSFLKESKNLSFKKKKIEEKKYLFAFINHVFCIIKDSDSKYEYKFNKRNKAINLISKLSKTIKINSEFINKIKFINEYVIYKNLE